MSNNRNNVLDMAVACFGSWLIGIVSVLFYIGISESDLGDFYKKGQIDAINGIIKYESINREDWIKIKENR